jgi:hypothetical protein
VAVELNGNTPLQTHTEARIVAMRILPVLLLTFFGLAACTPTVQVRAPEEPITINLNVKIEHEIKVKVDKELDDLFDEDSALF